MAHGPASRLRTRRAQATLRLEELQRRMETEERYKLDMQVRPQLRRLEISCAPTLAAQPIKQPAVSLTRCPFPAPFERSRAWTP